MKNFNVFGVHGKIRVLEAGRFVGKPIYRGGLPKKEESWTVCRFLRSGGRRGLAKKRGVMFLRGG